MTSFTIYLYHVPTNEANNFREFHFRFSRGIARFFNCIMCGYWIIEIPEEMNRIVDLTNQDSEEANQLIYDKDGIQLLVIRNNEKDKRRTLQLASIPI